MKKTIIILLLCLAAVPAFISCKKDDVPMVGYHYSLTNTKWKSSYSTSEPQVSLNFVTKNQVHIFIGDVKHTYIPFTLDGDNIIFQRHQSSTVTLTDGDKSAVVTYTYEDATIYSDKKIKLYLTATVNSNPDNLYVREGRFSVTCKKQ
jgi:hypothetical protein